MQTFKEYLNKKYILEAKKLKPSPLENTNVKSVDSLSSLWQEHGNTWRDLDFHTNERRGSADMIPKLQKRLTDIENKTAKLHGEDKAAAMIKHTELLSDHWYGHTGQKTQRTAAMKLRDAHGISWDGDDPDIKTYGKRSKKI